MKLKISYNQGLVFLVSLISMPCSVFSANDIQIVTNVSVDVTSFDIQVDESFGGSGSATWDNSIESRSISNVSASSTLGVNIIKGDMSYGMTALISGSEPAGIEGRTRFGGGSSTKNSVDSVINRTSYSFLSGYRLNNNYSAYAGYTFQTTQSGSTFTFEDNGVFIGAKYGMRTSASSSLTFNAAYSLTASAIEVKNNSLLGDYQMDGNANAYSLGATWLYSLDRGRSFYFRVKHSVLQLDGRKNGVSPALNVSGSVKVTAEQAYTTFSLGMGF